MLLLRWLSAASWTPVYESFLCQDGGFEKVRMHATVQFVEDPNIAAQLRPLDNRGLVNHHREQD